MDDHSRGSSKALPKILLVEDNEEIRELIVRTLSSAFQVQCASNASEALGQVRDHAFDLLLVDFGLPGITGLELCESLRKLPELKATKFMFVTGNATAELRKRASELGVLDIVSKPFRPSELTERILRALGQ